VQVRDSLWNQIAASAPKVALNRVPTKLSGHAGETIFRSPQENPETNTGYQWRMIKQRGAIMWDTIISRIYHQSRRSYLAAIVAAIALASASANAGQSRSLSFASSEPPSAAVEQPKAQQTADTPVSEVARPELARS
jgi:hypothetical protein